MLVNYSPSGWKCFCSPPHKSISNHLGMHLQHYISAFNKLEYLLKPTDFFITILMCATNKRIKFWMVYWKCKAVNSIQ